MSAILGFDTATARLDVAVVADGAVVVERSVEADETGRPRHATHLLPAISECVEAAGGWERIARIGVGAGPGTFTGLRIGIATARALAQAREIPIAAVSSLAALAAGLPGAAPRLPVIDAKRGEAFAALYGPDGAQVWEPFVASPDELACRVAGLAQPPLAAGDGSLRFRESLEQAGATVPGPGDEAHLLRARHLCELVAATEPVVPAAIEPIYLRRPDAELWRERDRGAGGPG
jgi:tRNA threonylcarbamoyladenosine biosynthesis protein TsaB